MIYSMDNPAVGDVCAWCDEELSRHRPARRPK